MRKYLLLVITTLMLSVSVTAQIHEDVAFTVEGSTVLVSGAEGQVLEVISLTGRKVAEYRIDSPSQRVELNISKGCYVLKVGKVVRKVAIC